MTRAEQLLKEAKTMIREAKEKSFEEYFKSRCEIPNNQYLKECYLTEYNNARNNIVVIRTTQKNISEIQKLGKVEIIVTSGVKNSHYKVKVS